MALLKPGPIGTISGRLASTQFAAGRSSVIVSQPTLSTNKTSIIATNARKRFAHYTAYWHSSAMAALRPAWNAYAKLHPIKDRFGTQRYLSGYQSWLAFIPLMEYYGFSATSPPQFQRTNNIVSASMTISTAGAFSLTSEGWYDTAYTKEFVWISRFYRAWSKKRHYSWIALPPVDKDADTISYGSAIQAMNQIPVLGEYWAVRIVWWTSAQLPTPPTIISDYAAT